MTPDLPVSTTGLLGLILRGALLYLILRGLGMLLALVPLRAQTKARLERTAPLLALLAWLGFAVLSIHQLLGAHPEAAALVITLVLLGCTLALFGPLRDVLTGVFLRASAAVREGDDLQVGELRGHVEQLGQRGVLLRTAQGDALVPYGQLDKGTILRRYGERGVRNHSFRVRPIPGLPQAELRRVVQEAALLSHWSCPSRAPDLTSIEEGALDVTVFAVAKEGGPEIESAVRARLGEVQQARSGEAVVAVTELATSREDRGEPETGVQ